VPFALARIGEAGRCYSPGDPVPAWLATPSGNNLELVDYCWPKQIMLELLSGAGFAHIHLLEPTAPPDYKGPNAKLLRHEVQHPLYVIYLARK